MTTEQNKKDEFIPVNQILNAKPQLGPIPGEQVIPWIVITVISYLVCQGLLQLDWWATLLVAVWGGASWWVLTGNESWRFLSKFHKVPNWTRGHMSYSSLLTAQKNNKKVASRTKKRKARTTRQRTQK